MEEIRKILREAMPKIIAPLVVAFIAGWVAFFWQKDKPQIAIAVGLVFGFVLFLVMLWLGRGKSSEKLPAEPTPPTVVVQVPPAVPTERPVPQPPRRRGPVGFVARHDEEGRDLVEVVTKALEGDGAVNLWGSGGVGKTTLAIEISHRLLPSLPGGVIWADADGRAEFNLAALLDGWGGRMPAPSPRRPRRPWPAPSWGRGAASWRWTTSKRPRSRRPS